MISEMEQLKAAIKRDWSSTPSPKAREYVGQFTHRTWTGLKIKGKVDGNYGMYTVSIDASKRMDSACSCYVGGDGGCKHCEALAATFLQDPESFKEKKPKTKRSVKTLDDIQSYLQGTTLDALLSELKAKGITQKAFAESIGMSTRHLSSVKSSELKNRYFHELGATKLACLWVLENCK